jgi:hypothetical protein
MAMPSATGDPLRCTKARMAVADDPDIRDWGRRLASSRAARQNRRLPSNSGASMSLPL